MLTLLTGRFKNWLTERTVLRYETEIVDYVRGLTEAEKADLVSAYRALGEALEKGDAPLQSLQYAEKMTGPNGVGFFPAAQALAGMTDEELIDRANGVRNGE